jgi:hypothetical protein
MASIFHPENLRVLQNLTTPLNNSSLNTTSNLLGEEHVWGAAIGVSIRVML